MKRLLEMDVRIDILDSQGRNSFLIFYERQNFAMAYKLAEKGANINQKDSNCISALQHAFNRKQYNEIGRLVGIGADINLTDTKGRTLLHQAVNMSSATADASFETEQLLIDLGININQRDHKMRVPLHYAFVKISDW